MNVTIISQIIAGLFALATTWLTIAYAKQSSVDKQKEDIISKLEQRLEGLESRPSSSEAQMLKQRIRDILAPKSGKLDRLRDTVRGLRSSGALTEEQKNRIDEIAHDLDEIDTSLENIARP